MAKILVAEDDPTLQSAYVTFLQAEGFDVQAVSDGQQALDAVAQSEPDVVLLDMLMPNLDGIGFLQRAHLVQNHPKTKVLVLSNVSVPYKMEEAELLGASEYVIKSNITPKEIVEKIHGLLQK